MASNNSFNNSNENIVPMGKAIAIIVSFILGIAVLIGGGVYLFFFMTSDVAVSSDISRGESPDEVLEKADEDSPHTVNEANPLDDTGTAESASPADIFNSVLEGYNDGDYISSSFALHDIDSDGVDELLIRYDDGMDEYTKLYTYADGEVNEIGEFWSRKRLLLDEQGDIYSIGSNGASSESLEAMRISDDGEALVTLEAWEMNGSVYSHITADGKETISEAEYQRAAEKFYLMEGGFIEALDWQTLTSSGAADGEPDPSAENFLTFNEPIFNFTISYPDWFEYKRFDGDDSDVMRNYSFTATGADDVFFNLLCSRIESITELAEIADAAGRDGASMLRNFKSLDVQAAVENRKAMYDAEGHSFELLDSFTAENSYTYIYKANDPYLDEHYSFVYKNYGSVANSKGIIQISINLYLPERLSGEYDRYLNIFETVANSLSSSGTFPEGGGAIADAAVPADEGDPAYSGIVGEWEMQEGNSNYHLILGADGTYTEHMRFIYGSGGWTHGHQYEVLSKDKIRITELNNWGTLEDGSYPDPYIYDVNYRLEGELLYFNDHVTPYRRYVEPVDVNALLDEEYEGTALSPVFENNSNIHKIIFNEARAYILDGDEYTRTRDPDFQSSYAESRYEVAVTMLEQQGYEDTPLYELARLRWANAYMQNMN